MMEVPGFLYKESLRQMQFRLGGWGLLPAEVEKVGVQYLGPGQKWGLSQYKWQSQVCVSR